MNEQNQARNRERILSSVTRDPNSECWLWSRQVSNTGYGRITLSSHLGTYIESAHRASYALFVAPIPQHGIVRQSCGNRLCVYPGHLELSYEP